ncbi:FAD dependent oxidoreductase-domain-containing protein [Baffinella frigidus]|nr:FAD dependent oxidoreductase-domain-containing protein [Cryptophyta sp. CCMP2293]
MRRPGALALLLLCTSPLFWAPASAYSLPTSARAARPPLVMAMSSAPHAPNGKVVVLGAGVIGASIAYHLAERDVAATVVDRAGIAKAASGKGGGVALDWNDGSGGGGGSRLSFKLHAELAEKLQLDSYRRMSCRAVAVEASGKPASKKLQDVEWVDLGVHGSRLMGDTSTIAQVHPRQLTEALMASAQCRGATFKVAKVEEVLTEANPAGGLKVVGVKMEGGDVIPADTVVVAMGPWSQTAAKGLTLPPIFGQKYHSVLMQNSRELSEAVFFQGLGDPEVYPRPKGEVYVTGFPDAPITVTEAPGEEEVRLEVGDRLVAAVRLASSELQQVALTRKTKHKTRNPTPQESKKRNTKHETRNPKPERVSYVPGTVW